MRINRFPLLISTFFIHDRSSIYSTMTGDFGTFKVSQFFLIINDHNTDFSYVSFDTPNIVTPRPLSLRVLIPLFKTVCKSDTFGR